jgi:RluA family pseudouridine synthase
VSKPAGQLVIEGRRLEDGAALSGKGEQPPCEDAAPLGTETLKAQVERHAGTKIFVVHRLDREASGLVLFAKDPDCHRLLCGQFARRQVHKTYQALASGAVAEDGIVKAPVREYGSGRMGVHPEGKPARTIYRVLKRLSAATLLEIEPLTGRRHQIRVHLYHIGHPIVGDDRYGKELPVGGAPRLMLHACRLVFRHPGGSESSPSCVRSGNTFGRTGGGRRLVLDAPTGGDFNVIVEKSAAGP